MASGKTPAELQHMLENWRPDDPAFMEEARRSFEPILREAIGSPEYAKDPLLQAEVERSFKALYPDRVAAAPSDRGEAPFAPVDE